MRARATAKLPTENNDFDNGITGEIAPWTIPLPPHTKTINALRPEDPVDIPTCKKILDLKSLNDRVIYTNGSKSPQEKPSYGIAMFNTNADLIQTDQGKLSAGKSINDAETMAIYKAMELALNETTFNFGRNKKVIILSDSRTGIDAVLNPKTSGSLAYLNLMRQDIDGREDRHLVDFTLRWVKGHSKNMGNELADHLAKTATIFKDPLPFTTHDKRRHYISKRRQQSWETWFNEKEHTYRSPPSRRLKRHRKLTRQDSSILFRLKTNKGWTGETIGTGITPTCDAEECPPHRIPDDGDHKFVCPARAEKRPPDISSLLRDPRKQSKTRSDVIEWICHHDHFGFRNKLYEVNFIKLRIGQYNRDRDFQCHLCDAILSRKAHLERHILNVHTNPSAHQSSNPRLNPYQGDEKVCNLCRAEFATRNNKVKHMAAHEKGTLKDGQTYMCDECDIAFDTRNKKDKHMDAHAKGTLKKSWCQKCEGCKKTFRTKGDKTKHQDEACGGICHGCSQTFTSRTRLKEHQRSNCGGSRS